MSATCAAQNALELVRFQDWTFHVGEVDGAHFLHVRFVADGVLQHGRRWLLSPDMTPSEVVQTAFKAVLTALEHEAREHFTYRGWAIFGPHFNVEALVALCHEGRAEASISAPVPLEGGAL